MELQSLTGKQLVLLRAGLALPVQWISTISSETKKILPRVLHVLYLKITFFYLNGILSQIVSASTYFLSFFFLYLLLATLRGRKFLAKDWTLPLLETIFPLVIVEKKSMISNQQNQGYQTIKP